MNLFKIPYELILTTGICLIAILSIIYFWKKIFIDSKRKGIWIAISTFLVFFLLIVGSDLMEYFNIQLDLMKYDINKNGIFDSNELNQEQTELYQLVISQSERNIWLLNGFITSFFTSIIAYFVSLVFVGKSKLENISSESSIVKIRILDSVNYSKLISLYKISERDSIQLEKDFFRILKRGTEISSQSLKSISKFQPQGMNMESWIKIEYERNNKIKEIYINTRMQSLLGGNDLLEKELVNRYLN